MGYRTHYYGYADITPTVPEQLIAEFNALGFTKNRSADTVPHGPYWIAEDGESLQIYDDEFKDYSQDENVYQVTTWLVEHGFNANGLFEWNGEEPNDFGHVVWCNGRGQVNAALIQVRDTWQGHQPEPVAPVEFVPTPEDVGTSQEEFVVGVRVFARNADEAKAKVESGEYEVIAQEPITL